MVRCTAQYAAIQDALDRRLPLGTIRAAQYLGFKNPGRYVWDACPVCDRRRWVPVKRRGRWCAACGNKKAVTTLKKDRALDAARQRNKFLIALGRAAEEHGWRPPGWEER